MTIYILHKKERVMYKSLDLFERDNVSFCSNKGINVNDNRKNKTTIDGAQKFRNGKNFDRNKNHKNKKKKFI